MSASSLLLVWLACICTSLASAYVVAGTSFAAAEAAEAKAADAETSFCLDSCRWANDTVCQDGGFDASVGSGRVCEFGTDCTDCGSRSPDYGGALFELIRRFGSGHMDSLAGPFGFGSLPAQDTYAEEDDFYEG